MKRIATFLLLTLLCKYAVATSIVVIVTPQYILLAADSKRQILDANAVVRSEVQVCKIKTAGPYCFALAGNTSSQATHYSAEKIVARHLQHERNYARAVQRIKAELKHVLTQDLRYRRKQQPAAFSSFAEKPEPILELVILRMHNGVPQMELIGFESGNADLVSVGSYTMRCPGDCPAGSQQVYLMGTYNGIEQYLASRQQPMAEPAVLAERLIMEQAKSTPSSVGGPVRLVRFSSSGTEWLK